MYAYAIFTAQCQNWLVLIETIHPAKLEILPGPSQKKKFTCLCLRDLNYGQTTSTMKLHSKQTGSQIYFQNTMKTLSCSLWFSPSTIWSFPGATWCVMSQQTTCRSRHRTQLFPLKPDIKRDCKNSSTLLTKRLFMLHTMSLFLFFEVMNILTFLGFNSLE